jgi:hypothetical protein
MAYEMWEFGKPSLTESVVASLILATVLLGGATIVWFAIKGVWWVIRGGKDGRD